jgi:hypothetical protein
MASSKGQAPGVLLPTVPQMPTGSVKGTRATSTKGSSRVVKVSTARTTPKARAPKIRVKTPKMPKDALALTVPHMKKIKNGREFSVKRKPVI